MSIEDDPNSSSILSLIIRVYRTEMLSGVLPGLAAIMTNLICQIFDVHGFIVTFDLWKRTSLRLHRMLSAFKSAHPSHDFVLSLSTL